MRSYLVAAFFAAAFVNTAAGHSWLEQLANIASNGSFVAEYGYPRGFKDKGAADFDQTSNVWLIPPLEQQPSFVSHSNVLCHPSQRVARQTAEYPRLRTVPGAMVAMRYAENGHATIPGGGKNLMGKPEKGGTVFVFGTQRPRQGEILLDVLQWTRDGLGGDRRGSLLASQNFDDGRCYQLGNGASLANARKAQTPNSIPGQPGSEHELLCETDVRIPDSVEAGKPYTMYWVWQWPNAPGKDPSYPHGKDEYYTSCVDVDVETSLSEHMDQPSRPLIQQDPMTEAVSEFRSRGVLTNDPLSLYSVPGFGGSYNPQHLSHAIHEARTCIQNNQAFTTTAASIATLSTITATIPFLAGRP